MEGVVWWSGGAVWSDIQLLCTLTQAGDVFLVAAWKLVIKISSHPLFASLSGRCARCTQLKWLYMAHISLECKQSALLQFVLKICSGQASTLGMSSICFLTSDLRQINCLMWIPNRSDQIQNIQHDIFMRELSIRLDTEDTWSTRMSPVAVLWLLVLYDKGGMVEVRGESVSFNRHLGFDGCWGATWGFVSFYSRGYRGEGLSYIQGLSCVSGWLGCPDRDVSHTDDAFRLFDTTEDRAGSWAADAVCVWKPK